MSLRIPGFILAAALLLGYRLIKPRPNPDRPIAGISLPCFSRARSLSSSNWRSFAGSPPRSAYLLM
jgi:hypothetical protein